MFETITTVFITSGSALLFAYWFRYTCILILNAKTPHDYAADLVRARGLLVVEVQSQLRANRSVDLSMLHSALERDYALIQSLLDRSAGEQLMLENRMLLIHYRVIQVWYRISRPLSATAALQALNEMSEVIVHFANVAGQEAAAV
jgi:hypothetical protein